jgi:hypothetical protein
VMAVTADASELKIDPIIDGAFAGDAAAVETEFAKAMVAGTYPGVIISAAQRQAAWLHKSAPHCATSARHDWPRLSTSSLPQPLKFASRRHSPRPLRSAR